MEFIRLVLRRYLSRSLRSLVRYLSQHSSKICGCHFTGNFFLIFIQFYRQITSSQCQWSSEQRIRLNFPISALYLHFSVLSPFQRFIPISAFYPHFSVLSPFQRFILISVSAFSFRFRDSVWAFYPYPANLHACVCVKVSRIRKLSYSNGNFR
jgi:hypothetical protein